MQEKEKPLSFREMQDHLEVAYNGEPVVLIDALDLALAEAVKSAVDTNKAAAVVIKMVVKQGRANELQVEVDLTTKEPKPRILPNQFFLDSRGRVFLADPRQPTLASVTPIRGEGGN